MKSVFHADSLAKSFGAQPVLKAASFWANANRITALLGRNGSGKTTLLRCALGLDSPDIGVIRFGPHLIERPALWKLARLGLFYLPQSGLLSRRMRLDLQVSLFRARFGIDHAAIPTCPLDLALHGRSFPDQLSGGERRLAELSLAMLRRPSCLVADEPLVGVEPRVAEIVLRSLRELADAGCAILITGHQAETLLDHADDVIWMVGGVTHHLGSSKDARRHRAFLQDYLGTRAPA